MNILFLTDGKVDDKMAVSGTNYHIYKVLSSNYNVIDFDTNLFDPVGIFIEKMYHFLGFQFFHDRTYLFQKRLARKIKNNISKKGIDLVFSTGSTPLSFLSTKVLKVFYTDSCFGMMAQYYWSGQKFPKLFFKEAYKIESRSILNADHIFYVTQWAKNSAMVLHKCDPKKVSVIFRGANFANPFSFNETVKFITNRLLFLEKKEVRFLFVGKEWKRKGGDIIDATLNVLLERGYQVELSIVGCHPVISGRLQQHCNFEGLLDSNDSQDCEKMNMLFQNASFYFQPSYKECMGIAFLEASSFGLPSIAQDTGGVSEVVNSNNGLLLKYSSSPNEFASAIEDCLSDKTSYIKKSYCAYKRFLDDWNWNAVSHKIMTDLENLFKKEL
jgi:glycosyltransferase involved in cell wall biosynthesis